MKALSNLRYLLINACVVGLSVAVTNCSSSDEGAASNELENNENVNPADAGENSGDSEVSPADSQGEGENSAIENDTAEAAVEANQGQEENPPIDNIGANNQASGTGAGEAINNAVETETPADEIAADPAVTSQAAIDSSISPAVDNASVPRAPSAPPVANPGSSGGGVVRYIRHDNTPVFAQPGGTSAVYTLDQGDHPLVTEEGEWARIQDGHYVSNANLSVKGIPRRRVPTQWQ